MMTGVMPPGEGPLAQSADVLLGLADALAARLASEARSRTSVAAQRALLRAIGVSGLAPDGRSLALEIVQRYVSTDRHPLRNGVTLPFALAAHEYDLEPQQLAIEVVQGNIDLAAEADLLRSHARSAPARLLLAAWLASADDRFEANRVARAELASLFGDPPPPCIAVEERAFDARDAATHIASLVPSGADLVRVRVPRDGELRDDLGVVAAEDEWPVGPDAPPPAGSQRGLAVLRAALDEAGARAGRYSRLAVRRVGLAAPELAVVAGFERVDVVFVDPMDAIVDVGVNPDRALADHAIAHSLLGRAGARLVLSAGPLTTPKQPQGPTDVAVAAGRGLALQALSRAFALRNGFPADRLELVACPAFTVTRDRPLQPVVEVGLRSVLFPQHRLVIDEAVSEAVGAALPGMLAAWLAGGARVGMVFVPGDQVRTVQARDGVRGAFAAAAAFGAARAVGELHGDGLEIARVELGAAIQTLREVERTGLASMLGRTDWIGGDGLERLGGDDPASAWAWGEGLEAQEAPAAR